MVCFILALNFVFIVWGWTSTTNNNNYRNNEKRFIGFLQPLKVDGRQIDSSFGTIRKKGFAFGSTNNRDIRTSIKDNNILLSSSSKTKSINKVDHPNKTPPTKKLNNETSNLIEFASHCLIDASPGIHQLENHIRNFDTHKIKNNNVANNSFQQKVNKIPHGGTHSTTTTTTNLVAHGSSLSKRIDKNEQHSQGTNKIRLFPRFYPNLFLSRIHLSSIRKQQESRKKKAVQQQQQQKQEDNYLPSKISGTVRTVNHTTSNTKYYMLSNLITSRNEIRSKLVGEGTKLLDKVKSKTASVTDTAQDVIELSSKLIQVVATDALDVAKAKKDETIKNIFHSTPEIDELVSWVETQSNKVGTGLSKKLHMDNTINIVDRYDNVSIRKTKRKENDKDQIQKVPITAAVSIIFKEKLTDIMAFIWVQIIRLVMKLGLEDEILLMLPIKMLVKILNICLQRKCRPGIIRVVSVELDRRVRKKIITNIDQLTDPLEDATKATLRKITGKDTYQFGDITRSVLKNLRVQETVAKSTDRLLSAKATRDMKQYIEQIVDEIQDFDNQLRHTVITTTTPLRRKISCVRIPLIPFTRLSKP